MSDKITVHIDGVDRVLTNISLLEKGTKVGLRLGLTKAGLVLQRISQTFVPVHYGNLKASAFTRLDAFPGSGVMIVFVGYTAAYAIYVHENMEMKLQGQERPYTAKGGYQGHYWDPAGRGQNKFLERPYRRHLKNLLAIISTSIIRQQRKFVK